MAIDFSKMTNDELRAQAKRNSLDWHTAESAAAKDALHRQNVEINRILDERTGSVSTYDAPSGSWTVTGGTDSPEQTLREMLGEYRTLYSGARSEAEQRQAAQEAAVRRAVNGLESQKADAERQYADLFRQLYVDQMKNRKALDQRLAAGGITGGAAETTRLGYDTAYEDALRQGEQERISALGSLDRAIADARLTGDIESANAAAKAAQERTNAYADALRYLIDRQDALDAKRTAYEREDAQRLAAYAQQLERERKEAEEQEKLAARPTLTAAQVNAAIKAGIRTGEVLRAYEYYYGQPYRS